MVTRDRRGVPPWYRRRPPGPLVCELCGAQFGDELRLATIVEHFETLHNGATPRLRTA